MCRTCPKPASSADVEEPSFLTSADFFVPFNLKYTDPLTPGPGTLDLSSKEEPEKDVHEGGATSPPVHQASKLAADDKPQKLGLLTEEIYQEDEKEEDGLMRDHREVGTLTDVCYKDDLDEVNLVSLIEEQIPRYILRADTLTDFAGYDHSDWIQTPVLPPDIDLDLSPVLIEETLKYFTLCAERVSQMTKTYNDIEAVTRLLEEKERDLELAARIGQTLLEKNKVVESRNEELEELLAEATEKVQQLRHEISMKDALLHVYTQDADSESPTDGQLLWTTGVVNLEAIQKKVKCLEHENLNLKLEHCQLKTETLNYEEKEALLVKDAIKNLTDANDHIKCIQDELGAKTDVNLRQQEEITNYMTKVITLEGKIKKQTVENAELQSHLTASQEAQRSLTTELTELTDKYHECMGLLHEAQEEIKALRRKKGLGVVRQHFSTFSPFLPEGSLASELESSLRNELPYPEGYSPNERKAHNRRIMDTAKCVRKSRKSGSLLSIPGSNQSTSGNESCESIAGSSNRSSLYLSEGESAMSESYSAEADNNMISCAPNLGRPGIPGSNDLETALRRLSMRKANEINEKNFKEEEEMRQMQRHDGASTPTPCRTPESMMSTGSGISDLSRISGYSALAFRIPEKLQIVKPMEGSATLHQWQRLATPHLGGLMDDRPGVQIKGERKLEMDEEIFMLSDFEEDDEFDLNPGKSYEQTSSVYTYTTSRIMHPTEYYDNTSVTNSYERVKPSVTAQPSPLKQLRDSHGTSTYSMSMGLATILRERGILPSRDSDSVGLDTGIQNMSVTNKVSGNPFGVNPLRFESIVTETMSDTTRSQTEVIYTNPQMVCSPVEGISATARPFLRPSNLDLVNKVMDAKMEEHVATQPESLPSFNSGLNSILTMKKPRPVRSLLPRHRSGMGTKVTEALPMSHAGATGPMGRYPSEMGAMANGPDNTSRGRVKPSALSTLVSSTLQKGPISSIISLEKNTSYSTSAVSPLAPMAEYSNTGSLNSRPVSPANSISEPLLRHLSLIQPKTDGLNGILGALTSTPKHPHRSLPQEHKS